MSYPLLSTDSIYRWKKDGLVDLSLATIALDNVTYAPASKTDEQVFGPNDQQYFKYADNQIADLVTDGSGSKLVVYDYAATSASKRAFANYESRGSIFVDVVPDVAYELVDKAIMKALRGDNSGNYFVFENIGFDIAMIEQQVVPDDVNGGSKIVPLVDISSTIIADILVPLDTNTYIKTAKYTYETSGQFLVYREHQDAPDDSIALHDFLYLSSYDVSSALYTNKIEVTPTTLTDGSFKRDAFGVFHRYDKVQSYALKRTATNNTSYFYIVDPSNNDYNSAIVYALGAAQPGDKIYTIKSNELKIVEIRTASGGGSGSYTGPNGQTIVEVPQGATTQTPTRKEFATLSTYAVSDEWREYSATDYSTIQQYKKSAANLIEKMSNDVDNRDYLAYGEDGLGVFATETAYSGSAGFDDSTSGPESITPTWSKSTDNIITEGAKYRSYKSAISRSSFATGSYDISDILIEMLSPPSSLSYEISDILKKIADGLLNVSVGKTINDYNNYTISTSYESYNDNGLHEFSVSTGPAANNTCLHKIETPNVLYTRKDRYVLSNPDNNYFADISGGENLQRYKFATVANPPYSGVSSGKKLYIMGAVSNYGNPVSSTNFYTYAQTNVIYREGEENITTMRVYYVANTASLTLAQFAASADYNNASLKGHIYQPMQNTGVNTGADDANVRYSWEALNLIKNEKISSPPTYEAYTDGALAYSAYSASKLDSSAVIEDKRTSKIVTTNNDSKYYINSNGTLQDKSSNPDTLYTFNSSISPYDYSISTSTASSMYTYTTDPSSVTVETTNYSVSRKSLLTRIASGNAGQYALFVVSYDQPGSPASYTAYDTIGLRNIAALSNGQPSLDINLMNIDRITIYATYKYVRQYTLRRTYISGNDVPYTQAYFSGTPGSSDEEITRYHFAKKTGGFEVVSNWIDLFILPSSNGAYEMDVNTHIRKYTIQSGKTNTILGSNISGTFANNNNKVSGYTIDRVNLAADGTYTLATFASGIGNITYSWQAMNGSGVAIAEKWISVARDLVRQGTKLGQDDLIYNFNAYTRSALAYTAVVSTTAYPVNLTVNLMDDPLTPLEPSGATFKKITNTFSSLAANAEGLMQSIDNSNNYYVFGKSPNYIAIINSFILNGVGSSDPYKINDILHVMDASGVTNPGDTFVVDAVSRYNLTYVSNATIIESYIASVNKLTDPSESYIELTNNTGLYNFAKNERSPPLFEVDDKARITDINAYTSIEYTYKGEYTVSTGTHTSPDKLKYYSYAPYEATNKTAEEAKVRYDFASIEEGSGFVDASDNDVLYIVTDTENIESGNNYTMIDNVGGLILGSATYSGLNGKYISKDEVNKVYFSDLSGSPPLTLAGFADLSGYDEYHFKNISIDNLDGATRYTWIAMDLVAESVAPNASHTKYVAFTEGALAYVATQLNSAPLKQVDLSGTTYHYSNTDNSLRVLTDLSGYTASTKYYQYSNNGVYDISRQLFAEGDRRRFSVDDILYEISYTTVNTPAKYATYTPSTDATITRKAENLIYVDNASGADFYEAWSNNGLRSGSAIALSGETVKLMPAATAFTALTNASGVLQLNKTSAPAEFYSFTGVDIGEDARRLSFAKKEGLFTGIFANDLLVIVAYDGTTASAYNASANNSYKYAADTAQTVDKYIYWEDQSTYLVVNIEGSGNSYDPNFTPANVTYTIAMFDDNSTVGLKWAVMNDADGTIISGSIYTTAGGYAGLLVLENGTYYASSEGALAYAARGKNGTSPVVPLGANIVARYFTPTVFANSLQWTKYLDGVLLNTISGEEANANRFRSYNAWGTENTLAGVPLVLYGDNEQLAVIDFSGVDTAPSSFNNNVLNFKKLVSRVGTESLKVEQPIVNPTQTTFEAFGPNGLYELAKLTPPDISSNNMIYRRNFGDKNQSGNYPLDASAPLLTTFTWAEQYMLKDNAGDIYYDYVLNSETADITNLNQDIYNLATKAVGSVFASAPNGTVLYDMSGLTTGSWADISGIIASNGFDGKYTLDTSGGSTGSYMVVRDGTAKRYLMVADRKVEFAGSSYYANGSTYAEINNGGETSDTQRVKAATDLLRLESSSTQYESYSEGGLQTYATTAATYSNTQVKLVNGVYSTKIGDVSGANGTVWLKNATLFNNNVLVDVSSNPVKHRVYAGAITARTFAESVNYDINDEMLIVDSNLDFAKYVYVKKIFQGVNTEDNRSEYNAVAYTYAGLRSAAEDSGSIVPSSATTASMILYDNSGTTVADINFTKVQPSLIEVDGEGRVPSVFFSYENVDETKLAEFAHSVEQNIDATNLDLAFVDNSENSVLYDVTGMDTDPTKTTETYRYVTKGVIDPSGEQAITITSADYSVYNIDPTDNYAYLRRAALYNGVAAQGVPTGSRIGFSGESFLKLTNSPVNFPYGLLSHNYKSSTSYVSFLAGDFSGETLSVSGEILSRREFANNSIYTNDKYLEMRTGDASGALVDSWLKKEVSTLLKEGENIDISYNLGGTVTNVNLVGVNPPPAGSKTLYHLYDYSGVFSNMANSLGAFANSGDYIENYVKIEDTTSSKYGKIYLLKGDGAVVDVTVDPAVTLIVISYRDLALSVKPAYTPSASEIYLKENDVPVFKYGQGILRKLGSGPAYTPLDTFYVYQSVDGDCTALRSTARKELVEPSGSYVPDIPNNSTVYFMGFPEQNLGLTDAVTYTKYADVSNVLFTGSGSSAIFREFNSYNSLTPHDFAATSGISNNATLIKTDLSGKDITGGLNVVTKYSATAVKESGAVYWAFPAGSVYAANATLEAIALDSGVAASTSIREVFSPSTKFDPATPTYSSSNDYTKADGTLYPNTLSSIDTDISAAYYTYVADASLNWVLNNYSNRVDISGLDLNGTAGTNSFNPANAVYPFIFDISGSTKIQYTHKDTGVLLRTSDITYHAYGDNGVVRAAQLDEIGSGSFTKDYPNSPAITFTRKVDGILVGNDTTYTVSASANEVLIYFKNVNSNPDDDRSNAYRVIKALARDVSGASSVLGLTEYSNGSVDLSNVRVVYDVLETPSAVKYEYQANGILKTNVVGATSFNYIAYTDLCNNALANIATNNGLTVDVSGLIREISGADTNMDTTIDYVKHADGLLMATAANGTYDSATASAYPYSERGVANYANLFARGEYPSGARTVKNLRLTIIQANGVSNINEIELYNGDSKVTAFNNTNYDVTGIGVSNGSNIINGQISNSGEESTAQENSSYLFTPKNGTIPPITFDSYKIYIYYISSFGWYARRWRLEGQVSDGAEWTLLHEELTPLTPTTNNTMNILTRSVAMTVGLSYTGPNLISIPTAQITTPYIWDRKGVVLYDASANPATQIIGRSSPYLFTNSLASRFNARVYTSSLADVSGFVDTVATTNAVTDPTYFKPGIYIEVGDVTGANTTSSRTNSYRVQKIEEFLVKYSNDLKYKAYENLTTQDGLARAALNDLSGGTQVDLSGTTWTKDASGALMYSNSTTYRHYTGSANPVFIRNAFPTTVMDISNALYKISTICGSTLNKYTWEGAYDLSESPFAYKLAGIVTPLPDPSGAISDDIIFGSTGVNSFASSSIYPAGFTINNVYANAPTNYTVSSLTKSNIPGTVLDKNTDTLTVTMQKSLAGVSGENPNPDTVVNSIEYMYYNLADVTNIIVAPTADLTDSEFRLVQTTVRDNSPNGTPDSSNMPDVLYNQFIVRLLADDYPTYYHVYRAVVERSTINNIPVGGYLTSGTLSNTTTLYPTEVPSSVLASTPTKTVNIYMYGDAGKTFGWKYVMNVYVVPVA